MQSLSIFSSPLLVIVPPEIASTACGSSGFAPPLRTPIETNFPSSKSFFPMNMLSNSVVLISAPSPGVSPLWSNVTPINCIHIRFKRNISIYRPPQSFSFNGNNYYFLTIIRHCIEYGKILLFKRFLLLNVQDNIECFYSGQPPLWNSGQSSL